eukprot:2735835-Rhodomonas_salina.1
MISICHYSFLWRFRMSLPLALAVASRFPYVISVCHYPWRLRAGAGWNADSVALSTTTAGGAGARGRAAALQAGHHLMDGAKASSRWCEHSKQQAYTAVPWVLCCFDFAPDVSRLYPDQCVGAALRASTVSPEELGHRVHLRNLL